jgi:hypothetical protein
VLALWGVRLEKLKWRPFTAANGPEPIVKFAIPANNEKCRSHSAGHAWVILKKV